MKYHETGANHNSIDEQDRVDIEEWNKKYQKLVRRNKDLMKEIYLLSNDNKELKAEITAVYQSFSWRIMKPFRMVSNCLKKIVIFGFCKRVLICLHTKGIWYTVRKIAGRIFKRKDWSWSNHIERDSLCFTVSTRTINEQKKYHFQSEHPFDVVTVIMDESVSEIEDMIQSVLNQTYENWHLYIVYNADSSVKIEIIKNKIKENEKITFWRSVSQVKSEALNQVIRDTPAEYKVMLDAKDLLHPSALFECQKALDDACYDLIYSDEAFFNINPNQVLDYHFKPDFSRVTLLGHNFINHPVVISDKLCKLTGNINAELDETSHYDWILRLIEQADQIYHIAKPFYFVRVYNNLPIIPASSEVLKMEIALQNYLMRNKIDGNVIPLKKAGTFKIEYDILKSPLVSILIPNKDYVSDLSNCIDSILNNTTYSNFEIVIIENNSNQEETFRFYQEVQKEYSNIHVIYWKDEFNYSAINNFGAQYASGEYLILLNNDVEVITPSWIEEMLQYAQQNRVGAVGAMLYYPDDTIQHAGVIIGVQGVGGHAHKDYKRNSEGYHNRLLIAQELSCVTAACMMLPKAVFLEVQGLDERLKVAFNDVDLCLRIVKSGYHVIFTPFAELYHYESKSRGMDETPEKRERFINEVKLFTEKWEKFLKQGDPFYNPNLTLEANDFSYKHDSK